METRLVVARGQEAGGGVTGRKRGWLQDDNMRDPYGDGNVLYLGDTHVSILVVMTVMYDVPS